MTVAEWKQAETQTVRMFGGCKLLVDGYNLFIRMEPYDAYKNCIMIYLDGKPTYKWRGEDCEIRRRFCCPVTSSAIRTKKQRDAFKKMSKKDQAAIKERMRFTYYLPYWNSFASLKRHLIANNNSIELVKEELADADL